MIRIILAFFFEISIIEFEFFEPTQEKKTISTTFKFKISMFQIQKRIEIKLKLKEKAKSFCTQAYSS